MGVDVVGGGGVGRFFINNLRGVRLSHLNFILSEYTRINIIFNTDKKTCVQFPLHIPTYMYGTYRRIEINISSFATRYASSSPPSLGSSTPERILPSIIITAFFILSGKMNVTK